MFYFILIILKYIGGLDGLDLYNPIDACVFKELQTDTSQSILHCAIQCSSKDCQGFQYDEKSSKCTLYSYDEICPSNTKCVNKTVYVNDRQREKIERFEILKGINDLYFGSSPSYFGIIDDSRATPIDIDIDGRIITVVGYFKNSRLIALPKWESYYWIESSDPVTVQLLNNVVTFLTGGLCKKYQECLHTIDSYQKYMKIENQVIFVNGSFDADRERVMNLIINKNWHIVIAATFWASRPVKSGIQTLANLYGICITGYGGDRNGLVKDNICKRIPITDLHRSCK